MKLLYQPSDKIIEEIESLASQGFFVKRSCRFMNSRLRYSCGSFKYAPTRCLSFEKKLSVLRKRIDEVFNTYACYLERNVYFVPQSNVEEFLQQVKGVREEIDQVGQSLVQNYDLIKREITERYRVILTWRWKYTFKNNGDPPDSFIEIKTREYIEKSFQKEKFEKPASLTVTPLGVLVDEKYKLFGDTNGVNKLRFLQIVSGIIRRRLNFYFLLRNRTKGILNSISSGALKSLLRELERFRKSVFYKDDALLGKVDGIKKKIVLSGKRDRLEIVEMMEDVMDYLSSNKDYYLGLHYAEK